MKNGLLEIALFNNSRKVGFGLWLAVISTMFYGASVFAAKAGLNAEQWLMCMVFAGTLIGGGTVADAWLKTKGGKANVEVPKP